MAIHVALLKVVEYQLVQRQLKVGTANALIIVTLLSRGSPSQLTLLVNLFCSHLYIASHTHFVAGFFSFGPIEMAQLQT